MKLKPRYQLSYISVSLSRRQYKNEQSRFCLEFLPFTLVNGFRKLQIDGVLTTFLND